AEQGPVLLNGYVANPSCERGNALMQYLFVNGRWVRDRQIGQAVREAYQGLLMTGRHAVVFLFLELPPDQVDVNVHPGKSEVRFRDAQAMCQLVQGAVGAALRRENLTPRFQASAWRRSTREPAQPEATLWPTAPASAVSRSVTPPAESTGLPG